MSRTYLFISDNMYAMAGHDFTARKNPDPKNGIVVTNVQQQKGNAFCNSMYSYEYEGVKYITSYAWSLVENTPQNVLMLKERNDLYDQIASLKEKVKNKTKQMKFIA